MTRTAWTIVAIVVVLLAIGVGVIYRGKLMSFLPANTPTEQATTTPQGPVWSEYATSTYSLQYPPEYSPNSFYAYDQFGPNKLIHGISFTIPAAMATGTNLSADTRISVEQLPRAKNCTADIFILDNVKATGTSESAVSYSFASTSGAAAGNRYEELVYAFPGSNPCTAVRYFIHTTVLENYPAGTVRQFDRAQLISEFNQIRRSLTLRSPQPQP